LNLKEAVVLHNNYLLLNLTTKSSGHSCIPINIYKHNNEDNILIYFISREVAELSPLPHSLPQITITNPYEEIGNFAVLGDYDQGATDDYQSSCDENEKEENDNNGITRKKSIVTFNDNVERIEIERL
jgi:hypothetical protein